MKQLVVIITYEDGSIVFVSADLVEFHNNPDPDLWTDGDSLNLNGVTSIEVSFQRSSRLVYKRKEGLKGAV